MAPELKKNAAAGMMCDLDDPLPAGDLFVGVDAGCDRTVRALMGNRRGFCDYQAQCCLLIHLHQMSPLSSQIPRRHSLTGS